MRMLDNAQWDFESNCFVCERSNHRGLQIPFAHDEARGAVIAEFALGPAFSGAPTYVHGGVVAAILDEAMAWAAIAVGGAFAVTSELSVCFLRPVRVGQPHRVEATLVERSRDAIGTQASIVDDRNRDCAIGLATLTPLGAAQAADAAGAELTGAAEALATAPERRTGRER